MMPVAFASDHHENLTDELFVLEYTTQAELADDIEAVFAALSYLAVVLGPVFEFELLVYNSANGCRYMAESIENKNQFDTFGQYSYFTLVSQLANDSLPPQHSYSIYLCNSLEFG